MRLKGIPFEVHTFNLLLRAVRECSLGSPRNVTLLLEEWTKLNQLTQKLRPQYHKDITMEWLPLESLQSGADEVLNLKQLSADHGEKNRQESALMKSSEPMELPNLLAPIDSNARQVLDLNFEALKNPCNRLQLVGGMEGVVNMMKRFGVKPRISTMTMLLDSVPCKNEAEDRLMEMVTELRVKPDTDFFNMIMKRRSSRKDLASAKAALLRLQRHELYPDIVTFGVLALGCSKRSLGLKLLQDIEAAGFKLNIEIIGALISNACSVPDFWYLEDLLKVMEKNQIYASPQALELIEVTKNKARDILLRRERGQTEGIPKVYLKRDFEEGFNSFIQYYKWWLRRVSVEIPQNWQDQHTFERTDTPKRGFLEFEKMMKEKLKQKYADKFELEDES
jgi:pentatricopeptide repeat domain-containing protein 1